MITLQDGTKLEPMEIVEKSFLEKDMGELLNKYNAVIIPVIVKDLSTISAQINIYKKVNPNNGESDNTKETKEKPNTETN